MGNVSPAQYEAFRAQMKSKKGVNIEASKAGAKGSADYLGGFNRMKECDKQEIAKSFDCKEDLVLQQDLANVMKKYKVRRYIDLIKNEGAAKELARLGIKVQSFGKKGWDKEDSATNGDRNWVISRIDPKTGEAKKTADGKLEQFKMKDFNSDSYIQNCELYVNDLLKIAGYDCASSLDLSDAELAQMASLAGKGESIPFDSNWKPSEFMQKYMVDMGINKEQAYQLEKMWGEMGLKGTSTEWADYELHGGKNSEEDDKDPRTKVSKAKFESYVDELIEQSEKDEKGEPTITEKQAEEILRDKYVIDNRYYSITL